MAQPRTLEEVRQECLEMGLGYYDVGVCNDPGCTGGGIVEDTFDGQCRWCSMQEKRPAGVVAPSMMTGTPEEWQAFISAGVQRCYDAGDLSQSLSLKAVVTG